MASAPEAATKDDEPETAIQQAARGIVESIKIEALADAKREKLELLQQPVLRFGDAPRSNDKGSVWVWQRAGRPNAIMELYRGGDGRSWVQVIHSLSQDALEGDFGQAGPRWTPPKRGVEWKDLSGAPVPDARPAVRTRQIKDLAQKFSAHEFWDPNNSRYELRLLIHPVHKYSDPQSGLLEGALFLVCHGTNPEVVLLIEAVDERGSSRFRYALARLGHAELHVAMEGNEVWRQERLADAHSGDAYWLVMHNVAP